MDRVCIVLLFFRPAQLFEYLSGKGVEGEDLAKLISSRPSVLGLKATEHLDKMVDYLEENGYSQEEVREYILKTL